jgi:alanine racemase
MGPLVPQDCVIHEANTFGVFRAATYHRSMARVGLALLGYGAEEFSKPEEFAFAAEAERLRPAARWLSALVQTRTIDAGTPVGYAGTWSAQRSSRVGVVPVGYADGYPLALSNRAKMGVTLRSGVKAFVPVIGRVSMDQTMLDLTDLPEGEAGLGSEVEVFGNDRTAPNHLPTLAHQAGTITHELLCRLSPRLARHYIAVEQPAGAAAPTERMAI